MKMTAPAEIPLVYQEGISDVYTPVSSFGIDKLKVFTTDFEVSSLENWKVHQPIKNAGQLAPDESILCAVGGLPYVGSKAFVNQPQYTVEIHHGAFWVSFNPSKQAGQLTTDPNLIFEQLAAIRMNIRDTLQADFAVDFARLSRIDFAVDAEMKHNVKAYRDLLSSTKKSSRTNETLYPSSVTLGSAKSGWELCGYDKGKKELLDIGYKNPGETSKMRMECRALTAEKIKSISPFQYINQVLNAPVSDLHRMYSRITNHFLNLKQQGIPFPKYDRTALLNVALDIIQKHPKAYVYPLLFAISGEVDTIGDVRSFVADLLRTRNQLKGKPPPDEKTIRERTKDIQNAILETSAYRVQLSKETEINTFLKYQELMGKFITPYKTAS